MVNRFSSLKMGRRKVNKTKEAAPFERSQFVDVGND